MWIWLHHSLSVGFIISSVTLSCPTLVTPWNAACQLFVLLHQFPKLAKTHIHRVGDAIQPSHPLYPLLLLPSIFPSIRVFSKESVLPISWPKYLSFSLASVLPMNIQDWFPLRWTGLISLQSKGLSRVFSNSTVQKHQFFCTQLSFFFSYFSPEHPSNGFFFFFLFVVNFVIHWNETAMGLHVFPIPIPPPTSLSTRSP